SSPTGRSEMKNIREPLNVMNGSASRCVPENAAVTGADHWPSTKFDSLIVHHENASLLVMKYSLRPSSENAGCVSNPAAVEITPSPKRRGDDGEGAVAVAVGG